MSKRQLFKEHEVIFVSDEGEHPRLKAILTSSDIVSFLYTYYNGLELVRRIEEKLRDIIVEVLNPQEMTEALKSTVGTNKQDSNKPRKFFEQLDFGEETKLILHPKNWDRFQKYLEPQIWFEDLMAKKVRRIRNQIAHFRDDISLLQLEILQDALRWLESRPPREQPSTSEVSPETVSQVATSLAEQPGTIKIRKYTPIKVWLEGLSQQNQYEVRTSFGDLEKLIKDELPAYARKKDNTWWANVKDGRSQAASWLNAGWRATDVDVEKQEVTFRKIAR